MHCYYAVPKYNSCVEAFLTSLNKQLRDSEVTNIIFVRH